MAFCCAPDREHWSRFQFCRREVQAKRGSAARLITTICCQERSKNCVVSRAGGLPTSAASGSIAPQSIYEPTAQRAHCSVKVPESRTSYDETNARNGKQAEFRDRPFTTLSLSRPSQVPLGRVFPAASGSSRQPAAPSARKTLSTRVTWASHHLAAAPPPSTASDRGFFVLANEAHPCPMLDPFHEPRAQSPGITLILVGAPPASAGPHTTRSADSSETS
jgi:hypothetical protein